MIDIQPRRPEWLRVRLPQGPNYADLKVLARELDLHTVCEEAHCPNIGECWEQRTATFMILGRVCTRSCGFCAVETGRPEGLDTMEPLRVAAAIRRIGLKHAVITSVNRDELPDGGAAIFADTIRHTRRLNPETAIEVLIPDFKGNREALELVLAARPDILNHNTETVPRLYRQVRPQAIYTRSLELLRRVHELDATVVSKSGIMVGLGETREEIAQVLRDLRLADCEVLTVGQYLQPTKQHLPIQRYYHPDEFAEIKAEALALGFKHAECGPLVRSSYHAHEQVTGVKGG